MPPRRAAFLAPAILTAALLGCRPLVPRPGAPAPPAAPAAPRSGIVRVALAEAVESVTIQSGEETIVVRPGGAGEPPGMPGELLVARGNAPPARQDAAEFRVGPAADGAAPRWNGRGWRGELRVLRRPAGDLTLVNVVAVEDYLRGVVPAEIGGGAPEVFEAVKAQAVAARTYAYRSAGQYDPAEFDLYASVRDQVYQGIEGETVPCDRAIRETAGEVLMYERELVRTYYSSTCGGQTGRVEDLWEKPPAPYLREVADRPRGAGEEASWCRASPHFRWEERWSAEELAAVLTRTLPDAGYRRPVAPGDVKDIRAEAYGRSGRVKWLSISLPGEEVRIFGDAVRWTLRPAKGEGILRSARIRLEVKHRGGAVRELVVRGSGSGHGIGMCQMGALGMARAGHGYREILAHYYSGTRLERAGAVP